MNSKVKYLIKLSLINLFFIFLTGFSSEIFAKTGINTQSVIGLWQTTDGKTKKPSSIIKIQLQGQFVEGRIVKTFSIPGEAQTKGCTQCKGKEKNKPVIGLLVIKNMQCFPGYCAHGMVLDPRNGAIYHATMHLFDQGMKLKVRGYIGLPLFGKTVIWNRVITKARMK